MHARRVECNHVDRLVDSLQTSTDVKFFINHGDDFPACVPPPPPPPPAAVATPSAAAAELMSTPTTRPVAPEQGLPSGCGAVAGAARLVPNATSDTVATTLSWAESWAIGAGLASLIIGLGLGLVACRRHASSS